jgi:glycosyltransferase involved in cell wall biosynthesis
MNVLMVNDYADERGGAEIYVTSLRRLLEQRGHRTRLLAGTATGLASLASRTFSLREYGRTAQAIQTFRPDVVHIHNCGRNVSPAPAVAAHRAGVPVVMTVHDAQLVCPKTWMIDHTGNACRAGFGARCIARNCHATRMGPRSAPYHAGRVAKVAVQRSLLRRAVDTFVCPSRWLQEQIAAAFPGATCEYLPNFAAGGATSDDGRSSRTLLFCGRLVREKGADLIVRALEEMPGVRLDVVGSGPELDNLERLAASLGVADRVVFHGTLAHARVNALYRSAAALVVPSRWMENSPLVVFEGLAAGIPIVGARRGGIQELVVEGETGALFTPDDPHDLASVTLALLGDPALRQRCSARAIARARAAFSPEAHVKAIEEIYRTTRGGAMTKPAPRAEESVAASTAEVRAA